MSKVAIGNKLYRNRYFYKLRFQSANLALSIYKTRYFYL